jgi:hypothetical protein
MSKALATVVSYCSNERNFARPLLRNAFAFSTAVVVAVGERLYNGDGEDEGHIARLRDAFPDAHFVRYPVPNGWDPVPLHNAAREAGVRRAREVLGDDCWVLLLDGDEVPDGERMRAWWASESPTPRDAYKLLNYWMFLDPRMVAGEYEDSALLAHASQLTTEALQHPRERDGIYMVRGDLVSVRRRVAGLDGAPLLWHFSWVRADRRSLHGKCVAWGHKDDRSWRTLIDDALDGLERGVVPERDFVHGYPLRLLPEPAFGWDPAPDK